MDRPSQSDFVCPECGSDRADAIVVGDPPSEPEWLAQNFAGAVADGLVTHEPEAADGEALGLHWRCANGHRFAHADRVDAG